MAWLEGSSSSVEGVEGLVSLPTNVKPCFLYSYGFKTSLYHDCKIFWVSADLATWFLSLLFESIAITYSSHGR